MEVFLEQFIPSDKDKETLKRIKIIVIAVLLVGIMIFFTISSIIAVVLQIAAVVFFFISYFSFVDYEYELYNGNIDISRIYAGSTRRVAGKINKEDVERIYETLEISNKSQALFNKNIKELKIYTFEMKDNKKIQLALNEELWTYVNIVDTFFSFFKQIL